MAAPNNEFYGCTEEQLLDWLHDAQKALATGKTMTSFSNEAGSSSFLMNLTPEQRIRKLQRALYEIDNTRYAIFEAADQSFAAPVFNVSSRAY